MAVRILRTWVRQWSSRMNAVSAATGSVSSTLKSLPKTVTAVDGDIQATSKAIDNELKILLKAVSDTQKSLNRFSSELERRAEH